MKLSKSEFRDFLLAEPFSEGHETVESWLGEVDDSAFRELLGDTEDELIDEYVWDALSDDELPGFESNFLSIDERRRKLSFSLSFGRALKDYAEDHAAQVSRKEEEPLRDLLPFRPRLPAFITRPAWSLAMAATLAAITVGGVWMLVGNQRLESRLAQVSSERAALQEELESLKDASQTGDTAVAGALTSIASIWLSPGLMRGGGEMERVIVPADASLVELLLDLGVDDYASYRAALYDAEGDEVWTQSKLDAKKIRDRVAVAVTLPTTLLPEGEGDYFILLSGMTTSGDLEVTFKYDFGVLRD